MANEGIKLTIPGADYEEIIVDDYLIASGITNPTIKTHYLNFKNLLISNGIWSKITHAYAVLGTTADQIKYNIKTASDPLTNAGGGTILNTINKGIILAGVLNAQGATVDLPINETYIANLASGNGHVLYFTNENLNPTNTVTPGLGVPISSNLFATSTAPLFYLTGAFGASPQKKALYLRNTNSQLAAPYLSKGVFGVIKNGATSEFFGNGVSLGTATHTGTANTFTGNIRLGDGKYPVANTISFVSFGNVAMSSSEMVFYQNAIIQLIFNVHGIII